MPKTAPALVRIAFPALFLIAAAPWAWAADEPSVPYVVKATDKLITMSKTRFKTPQDWLEIAKFNNLKDANAIREGQVINIPLRFMQLKPADATLVSTSGDVQLGGNAATVGTKVPAGSELKTQANSSAVLELSDGSRVTLLPNTLATLVTSQNYALRDAGKSASTNWFSGLIRLAQGGLETLATKGATRATPLQVLTPTSLVGVRGTQFRVAFDDPASDGARTEVVEGLVRADNPAQQSSAQLPKGTGAVIKPAEKEVKVVKLLPAPDLSAIPAEVLKPQAAWPLPVVAGADAYRVQVASDAKFEKIVRDLKVTGTSVDLATLVNGAWYARVRGIDPAGIEGFDAVKAINVRDSEWRVSYSSLHIENGQTVLLWTGQQPDGRPMRSADYTATLASDAALSNVLATRDTSTYRMPLGELKPGTYFIRIRSKQAQDGALISEIYRFEIPSDWGQGVPDIKSALQPVK